uniref:hypothetical protein n=1 Tax=Mariniflexile sp. TaxID=1979402 RepID=UPI004048C439
MKKLKQTTLLCIILINLFSMLAFAQAPIIYDVVLSGGSVMDPETKLDVIKNVGIINNRIVQISKLNR